MLSSASKGTRCQAWQAEFSPQTHVWKERADSHRLSSDFYMCDVAWPVFLSHCLETTIINNFKNQGYRIFLIIFVTMQSSGFHCNTFKHIHYYPLFLASSQLSLLSPPCSIAGLFPLPVKSPLPLLYHISSINL